MSIKDMKHVTVEQVLALRDEAIRIEQERDAMGEEKEKVEAERDTWRRVVEILEAEKQALAAHVDRFGEIRDEFMRGKVSSSETCSAFLESARDTPETSLASRDARIKAEALEELASALSLNAENARENGYLAAADTMQDAADCALIKSEAVRQAEDSQ